MASESLASYWQQAGELLGFTVEAPYVVVLADGQPLAFLARLPDFGAERGMLLSDSYEDFALYAKALIAAGYGYSVISAPFNGAIVSEDIVHVLQDWGWSASSACPEWLSET